MKRRTKIETIVVFVIALVLVLILQTHAFACPEIYITVEGDNEGVKWQGDENSKPQPLPVNNLNWHTINIPNPPETDFLWAGKDTPDIYLDDIWAVRIKNNTNQSLTDFHLSFSISPIEPYSGGPSGQGSFVFPESSNLFKTHRETCIPNPLELTDKWKVDFFNDNYPCVLDPGGILKIEWRANVGYPIKTLSVKPTVIPESSTCLLLFFGLVVIGGIKKKFG